MEGNYNNDQTPRSHIDSSFPPHSVQSLSHVRLFATPWIAARQASLCITISRSSLSLTSIESVMPSSHLILCHPLLLLPPIPPSIRVFSNESVLRMRWPKYWSFSFSIIPSKEIPGLIAFRMNWLDLLAVQGTLSHLNHQQSLLILPQKHVPFCPALARTNHHHLSVNSYINLWLVSPLRLLALLLPISMWQLEPFIYSLNQIHLLPTNDFPLCLIWSSQALPELTSASLFDQSLHGWSPHSLSSSLSGLLSMPSICQVSSSLL